MVIHKLYLRLYCINKLKNIMKNQITFTSDKLEFTIGFHDETKQTGWFEYSDIKTGGDNIYAEGGLWFDGHELVDYDGVYELPVEILDKLESLSYDVSEMRD